MHARRWLVVLLLFCSGFCSLVYQTVWMREFRLIFGASTASSAAVLALFIGGLGVGSLYLGGRAEAHPRPLALYGGLEVLIALTAAVTPGLLWLVRWLYLASGGSVVLGMGVATVARLLLAALVLGAPTVLMGGTLPAAARAVTAEGDARRAGFAMVYAANTLGAVAGSALSTFVLLEALGNRGTLWVAATLNVAVAIIARLVAWAPLRVDLAAQPVAGRACGSASPPRAAQAPSAAEPTASMAGPGPDPTNGLGATPASTSLEAEPKASTLGPGPDQTIGLGGKKPTQWAAAIVGFVFFLMELVWYRMLGPLLGGSVFTFGAILAVALLGVGAGSIGYGLVGQERRATVGGFALTCLLEAFFLAVPYALGDRLAVVAVVLRPLGAFGFEGHVLAWMSITALVVLPASIVSGVQFPLLVGLLGQGRGEVGRDTGRAYAWNTAGAIVGSLAGGFGLMPLLGARGCWRLVVGMLVALGLGAAALAAARERRWWSALTPAAIGAAALALLMAQGPTAVWRHSPIGAGRVSTDVARSPQTLRSWYHHQRHVVRREFEGRESSVGLDQTSGLSFVVNGKIDGNAIYDGPTQVMLGLMGAVLHPNPRRSLVIGLGTGSTAGWLADLPTNERVDVAELEPSMLHVAAECAPVNRNALKNPRLRVLLGDARELATVGRDRYDLITSEPSNPYRAGIASLFTRDFYEIVAKRLDEGGLFLQWVQAYEIDAQTIRTIYATFRSVFPVVETWQLRDADVLLVGSFKPIDYDADAMRRRIAQEPLRTALMDTWRVDDLEGVLAHHVARPAFADAVAASYKGPLNTDDRCVVEFGFARGVAATVRSVEFQEMRAAADARGDHRPAIRGEVDWEQVEDVRLGMPVVEAYAPALVSTFPPERWQRASAHKGYVEGNLKQALDAWNAQPKKPRAPVEIEVVAGALADQASDDALPLIERMRAHHPADADGTLAWLRYRQLRVPEAVEALDRVFASHRHDPFPSPIIIQRALALAEEIAAQDRDAARRFFASLAQPFVLHAMNTGRLATRLKLAQLLDDASCVEAFAAYEPHVPWEGGSLQQRALCYQKHAPARALDAERDLAEWRRHEPTAVLPR